MNEIGKRAYEALAERAKANGISVKKLCEGTGIAYQSAHYWGKGDAAPSAFYLAMMVELGFDVIYILTGKEDEA